MENLIQVSEEINLDVDGIKKGTVSSTGNNKVVVWNTITGEPSIILEYMLNTQMKKTINGKRVFSQNQPAIAPVTGTLKCWLHPDGENRADYDDMGLPTCRKSNLRSAYQVEMHMQRKHRSEYAIIKKSIADAKEEEERKSKDADRKLQRELLKSVTKRR